MKLLSFGTFPMFPTQKKILPAPFARLDTPVSSSRDVTQPWLFSCMALHPMVWTYCWWTKSCTTKDDDYPIIYRVLTIPGGAGFRPSTVFHPQRFGSNWCWILEQSSFSSSFGLAELGWLRDTRLVKLSFFPKTSAKKWWKLSRTTAHWKFPSIFHESESAVITRDFDHQRSIFQVQSLRRQIKA